MIIKNQISEDGTHEAISNAYMFNKKKESDVKDAGKAKQQACEGIEKSTQRSPISNLKTTTGVEEAISFALVKVASNSSLLFLLDTNPIFQPAGGRSFPRRSKKPRAGRSFSLATEFYSQY